jgi:ribose/xylose/arabinose/galactoside ABC-type transport system permease subunit
MSQPPYQADPQYQLEPRYQVEEEPNTTIFLDQPPGPPEPLAPPAGPTSGRPTEGDRVWIHLVWEALLAMAVVFAYFGVRRVNSDALAGTGLDNLLIQIAILGFVATGLAFSLRAAVPNLAVGAIATGSGVVVVRLVTDRDWGYTAAISVAILSAAAVGLLLALVVVGFNVPAWAASLGASVLLAAVAIGSIGSALKGFPERPPNPVSSAWLWAGLFAAISIGGGLVWLIPGLRRGLSGMRHDRDPARRPSVGGAFGGLLALVISSMLASVGGVLSVLRIGSVQPQGLDPTTWVALGAVLLGGVSVFGRRAGVFGTVLGVALLVLIQLWLILKSVDSWVFMAVTGGAILVGLIVNRFLEAAGRKQLWSSQYYG